MLETTHEFSYEVDLDTPINVGRGPNGTRLIYRIAGGRVRGNRINGRVLPGGADWMLLNSNGWGRIDVRGQIETNDGAVIYVSYRGVLEMTEAVTRSRGTDTHFADQYFRCNPVLETGAPDYEWVNNTLFVSKGRMSATGVAYEVYRID